MAEVAPDFPARNLPVFLYGKTGTPGNPEIPETGRNGNAGNDDKRLPWTSYMVLWDNFGSGVCNVRVVRHPSTVRHPQTFSDGACWSDWATGKRRPADLFGQLLAQGFANQVEQHRALAEFATVTGCGWAGRMLAGLQAWGEAPDDRLAALERQNIGLRATTKKLSRLAVAAMRRLTPEDRAELYRSSGEDRL